MGAFPLNFRASGQSENGLFCLPLFRRSYFHFFPPTRSRLRQPPTVVELRRNNKNTADVSARTPLAVFILADWFGPDRRRCPGRPYAAGFLFSCNINKIIKAQEGNPITQEAY